MIVLLAYAVIGIAFWLHFVRRPLWLVRFENREISVTASTYAGRGDTISYVLDGVRHEFVVQKGGRAIDLIAAVEEGI